MAEYDLDGMLENADKLTTTLSRLRNTIDTVKNLRNQFDPEIMSCNGNGQQMDALVNDMETIYTRVSNLQKFFRESVEKLENAERTVQNNYLNTVGNSFNSLVNSMRSGLESFENFNSNLNEEQKRKNRAAFYDGEGEMPAELINENIGMGLYNVATGLVDGLGNLVLHPVKSAVGIAEFLETFVDEKKKEQFYENVGTEVEQAWHKFVSEDPYSKTAEISELIGNIALLFVGGGAATDGVKGAQAAGDAAKVSKAAETAEDAAKLDQELGKADKAADAVNDAEKAAEEVGNATYNSIKDGLNFSSKAAEHMDESGRVVPTQTLRDAIESTEGVRDPQGSGAMMHYTTMSKNGKMYNLEVLYNEKTNTVYHFEYTRDAIGNLPAIKK